MSQTVFSLTPSIEARLSGWERLQFAATHPEARKLRPTVTISRQFGCEGYPLAEAVKARMEAASGEPWGLFDKALIEKVAQEEGIPPRFLENLGDLSRSLESLGLHGDQYLTQNAAYAKVARTVRDVGRVGNAVLVGRGSSILCAGFTNAFHFRLVADEGFRSQSLQDRFGISAAEAAGMLKQNTRAREKFISECLGEDITELRHYDAVFNNARQGVEAIADAILAMVKAAWADPTYFR